ncbi:MAG: pyruvate:ferredoxin (flavodoxin) oxidoreductase [Candidatus Melainabacteria bacterium]|nr:pyruvate:ferredoxin (flavodoxin) oxidoreductase [Candidatus Melainabacteria bacterium]
MKINQAAFEKTTKDAPACQSKTKTVDGNEATAYVAYRTNELIAIYPITPSSPMAEHADAWASQRITNLWGSVPLIQEMQSEGGAAGAAHGALQAGALTTSFTASQGLLLMIPNMFKIAGELTSATLHITARSIATHGLSIFCDHGDVMATRSAGWAMLFANSVQEAHDFALISQASTLEARVPFLHIFDGFRTSHEVSKIQLLSEDDMRCLIDDELVRGHRLRALSPDNPVIRGTAQNPDVFFQSRERANSYYDKTPSIVAEAMEKFAAVTGRQYRLFDYAGAADAERVIVAMGSAAETIEQVTNVLVSQGEKVGHLKVRLFRPFHVGYFLEALPFSVKSVAVLDRTKEPGAAGEPLLQDVITAIFESKRPIEVIGGRYGLGSKEFTPGMCKAVFDELDKAHPRRRFTVGIKDDVSHISLDYDENFDIESGDTVRAIFWGLGSDGTVGANKNSIKIIGEQTDNHAQGYFVYDSKKSGSVTVSHLRFGPRPIHAPYLISRASFIAVHQFQFVERFPVLAQAVEGATVLLNSPYGPDEVMNHLPTAFKEQLLEKKLALYVLDAVAVARETGMGTRINTIMQAGFFALSGVLPAEEAIAQIKVAIKKTYGKFGEPVVRKNFAAVDAALDHLHKVDITKHNFLQKTPAESLSPREKTDTDFKECTNCGHSSCSTDAVPAQSACGRVSQFTTLEMIAGRGDLLPVSALPPDGTFPTSTARLEKRDIALEVPVWDPSVCIQCGKCVMVCPHSVIRTKVATQEYFSSSPAGFKTQPASWREFPDQLFTLQVSAEDCTGCGLCVEICPAKNKSAVGRKAINMEEKSTINLKESRQNWEFFEQLPGPLENTVNFNTVKNVQLLEPLFEFSGACAGCGETPYVKLLSQLFGDHAMIANATGCSSIYGGNLPTTPWTTNRQGKGPAWANSLFEDNAEFGLGMRLALNVQGKRARQLLLELKDEIGAELTDALLAGEPDTGLPVAGLQQGNHRSSVDTTREKVAMLKEKLSHSDNIRAADLLNLADTLVKRSVWIVGGDGWAYDIGYGGLDHVLASGENVNILVLDTEVYSNTGGQMSKSTARGAVAKFAAGGKSNAKKDLGRLAISYGNVYVAQVAMGANDTHTLKAFTEAEVYPGTSLIIAYSHCIAHGINMTKGMNQQRLAVQSGHWPLYRFDPRLAESGQVPFQIDCGAPSIALEDYYYSETRYRMLKQSDPAAAARLLKEAKLDIAQQWQNMKLMAQGQSKAGQNP